MMGQQTMMLKRTLVLLMVMAATLIVASGVAFAVSKVCRAGTTQASPCSGTKNNDTLRGTSGVDYIMALAGNDIISAGAGNDTTDGGTGNDTYSYTNGWGQDIVIDSSGTDALDLSAVQAGPFYIQLSFADGAKNYVDALANSAERVSFPSGTVIEKATGSSDHDTVQTGEATNTLQPGPGAGGADLTDFGGCPSPHCDTSKPVSSDTYSGFSASGYGPVRIEDWGGTADKLVLPFASIDVYFEAYNQDNDQANDGLVLLTSDTDMVNISGQLEPVYLGGAFSRGGT